MNDNELMNVLKEHGQEHIYEAYQKLDEAGKAKLAAQVEKIDWSMVAMAGHEELAQERGKLEPLSALDLKLRQAMQYELKEMQRLQALLMEDTFIQSRGSVTDKMMNDYIERKAEWYIPAEEAISLKLANSYYK